MAALAGGGFSIISKIYLEIVPSRGISISLRRRFCTSLMDTLKPIIDMYIYILVGYTHPRYYRILATNNASCDFVAD